MSRDGAVALIVPQGKIVDFIDGALREDTPEEYVRQEIEKSLVREYSYPREEMAVEFGVKMGSSKKRADICIFPEGEKHSQETVWAVVECKSERVPPEHKTNGVEQLKSYMSACANAEYGMWTNGTMRYCCRKMRGKKGIEFAEISDLPTKGREPDEAERPKQGELRAATSDALLFAFRRCHNYIAGNQGLQKPEAFWELLKLIFCKIADERSDQVRFYATSTERQGLNGQMKVEERLGALFDQVRKRYSSIFRANEEIELERRVLAYIVSQLQSYSLLASDVDVKGKAYEELVGSNLRGDRGEFFTPRNVCRMAVTMLDPEPGEVVLDPACGTGGFLITAMNHVIEKMEAAHRAKWGDPDQLEQWQSAELTNAIRDYAQTCIVGIDLNPNLVKATKMNMVMNNDGSGGLYQGNSLAPPATWSDELRERQLLGNVDFVFTNPPFGSKIKVDDPAILAQFELAHQWDYDADADTFSMRADELQKSQPPEILFIERCVQFCKPGTGIAAIVLPDGILGSPGLAYVRDWVLTNTRVLASIDLHPDTFQPRNGTQTSILVLQRKSHRERELEQAAGRTADYQVFMALANHIGHDKRGNTTYVRDAEGNELVETAFERVREVHGGVETYRHVETTQKVVDDTTREIASRFRDWLETES